jgi:hypothetical protein
VTGTGPAEEEHGAVTLPVDFVGGVQADAATLHVASTAPAEMATATTDLANVFVSMTRTPW